MLKVGRARLRLSHLQKCSRKSVFNFGIDPIRIAPFSYSPLHEFVNIQSGYNHLL